MMRITRRTAPLAAALLFVLLAATHSAGAQAPTRDARFGLVGGFEAPALAAETGAAWEVVTFRWDALQPGGPADWNAGPELSTWPTEALSDGREVVGLLVGTPAWATGGAPGSGVPNGLALPADDPSNLWAGFVQQAVSYGAARGINRWIVWEAQDGAGWDGTVEGYYQLLKTAYVAARAANPAAVIHLGGLTGADPGWLDAFFDIAAADPTAPANDHYFDVVTVRAEFSPDALYTALQTPFVVMQQNGIPLKEVWADRAGIRLAVDSAAEPELAAPPDHPNVTLQQQAAYVVQAHALGFAANRGARIALYRLADDPTDGGEAWGLVRADGSTRPAYDAYQMVLREFGGFEFARRVDVAAEAELEGDSPVEYVRLTSADKIVHVVWATGQAGATLAIPARSEQARLLDVVGRESAVTPGEDGAYRVAVPPAACNDPQTGCLLGGDPYLLIEEALARDPRDQAAPPVSLEAAQPAPTLSAPATATASPTLTAATAPSATPLPPTTLPATMTPSQTPAPAPTAAPAVTPAAAEPGPPGWLPALLIAGGVLVGVAGAVYYLRGRR